MKPDQNFSQSGLENPGLLDNLHELVFQFRLDGKFTLINSAAARVLEYEKWEAPHMGFEQVLQSDQMGKWRKIKQRLANGVGYSSLEFTLKNKSGSDVHVVGSLYPGEEGDARHSVTGFFQDVTAARRAESERDHFFSVSSELLFVLGFDGKFKRGNPAFRRVLGYSEEEFLDHFFLEFVHPEDEAASIAEFTKLKHGFPSSNFENRCRRRDGSYRWLSWTGQPVSSENVIYAAARDVTYQREKKETLEKMAFTDALTGLYNRRGLFMVAERMLEIAVRMKMGVLVMVADLDEMKTINDKFGHTEGDVALMLTAKMLRERFRHSDIVGRLGGDEFVALLLTDSKDQSAIIRKSLENTLAEYNRQKNHPYSLGMSLGFAYARAGEAGISLQDLMERADRDMYEFKRVRRAKMTRIPK